MVISPCARCVTKHVYFTHLTKWQTHFLQPIWVRYTTWIVNTKLIISIFEMEPAFHKPQFTNIWVTFAFMFMSNTHFQDIIYMHFYGTARFPAYYFWQAALFECTQHTTLQTLDHSKSYRGSALSHHCFCEQKPFVRKKKNRRILKCLLAHATSLVTSQTLLYQHVRKVYQYIIKKIILAMHWYIGNNDSPTSH